MSTAVAEPEVKTQALAFPVQDFDVEAIKPTVMALTINGIEDKANQKLVKEWRLKCMRMRTGIESKRKEFKEVWLRGGQAVDETAKKLQATLAPLEQHCIALETEVENELKRIEQERQDALYAARLVQWTEAGGAKTDRAYILSHRDDEFAAVIEQLKVQQAEAVERKRIADEEAEALRIAQELLRQKQEEFDRKAAAEREAMRVTTERLQSFAGVGHFLDADTVAAMTPEKFDELLAVATATFLREQEQQAEIRRELEAKQKAEEAEAARLVQEQRDKELAERVARETEERLEREAKVREQERVAEEARIAKEAALKPAREKINTLCIRLMEVERPSISPEVDAKTRAAVNACIKALGKIADELE